MQPPKWVEIKKEVLKIPAASISSDLQAQERKKSKEQTALERWKKHSESVSNPSILQMRTLSSHVTKSIQAKTGRARSSVQVL